MKKFILINIKMIIKTLFSLFKNNSSFRRFVDIVCEQNSDNIKVVNLKKKSIRFYEVNSITKYRIDTFFTKEPETLAWIDTFKNKSTFWDIGANIGLYTIYAGKTKNCNVSAFEPSVFNLELLAKNIYINELHDQVNIMPIIISDKQSIGSFNNSSISNGAALSTLIGDKKLNLPLVSECKYKIPVFTLDSICKKFNIQKPQYLKIDVDGLEFNIINGAKNVLQNLDSLLIEVDMTQSNQEKEITHFLGEQGFYLKQNNHINSIAKTINQIWYKK